jgi:hypothetical protein
MSRLWTFLLGLLVGGAGVAFLYHSGSLPLGEKRHAVVVDARPAQGEMPKDDPSLIDAVAWPPPAGGKPDTAPAPTTPAPPADTLASTATVGQASATVAAAVSVKANATSPNQTRGTVRSAGVVGVASPKP